MDKTLRSVERCKLSAVFVALGLEAAPLLAVVPLAVDVLLLVVMPLAVVPLAVVLLAAVPLAVAVVCPALALGVPRIPPWAVAGTLWPLALEAFDLKSSSVSEPLMQRRELLKAPEGVSPMKHLRGINHTNHSSLTMSNLAAVEPDRVCIINSQRPDGLKFPSQKILHSENIFMKLPFRHEHLP
jgi:hypothetical protein